MDKLNENRIKPIISAIISGNSVNSDNYNNDLQYTIDLGIIKDTDSGIKISNQIYSEIIPRVLNKQAQDEIKVLISPKPFIKDGKLNFDALINEFQEFYRENAESWLNRFLYKEAGQQLLLMAFLQRIINGGGEIRREMALGSRRCDLAVYFGKDCFVMELKLKNQYKYLERGLDQLSAYMDMLGQKHGYLILFETKSSKEIPWDKRLNRYDTEHEYLDIKRNITVIEM